MEAGTRMPAAHSKELVGFIREWESSQLVGLLPSMLADLVKHLAVDGQPESAIQLARWLLQIEPISGEVQRYDRPEGRFSDWDYGEALRSICPPLAELLPIPTITLLAELLSDAIVRSGLFPQSQTGEDYSYIWRTDIPTNEYGAGDDPKEHLVTALYLTCQRVLAARADLLPTIYVHFRRQSLPVFHRIGLTCLELSPTPSPVIIGRALTDRALVDSTDTYHEFWGREKVFLHHLRRRSIPAARLN